MIETVFRGEDLPARDRFESWRAMVCASHAPVDVWTDHEGDFDATQRLMELGPVRVSEFTCPTVRSRRTPRQIRQSDPELYFLSFVRTGAATVDQGGRRASIGVGDAMLYSMSHPHQGELAPTRRTAMVEVILPRDLVPLPPDAVDRLLVTRLPARHGMGGLLTRFISQLIDETSGWTPADVPHLSRATLDLATAFLAHHTAEPSPPEAHPHALALRVKDFIDRHLRDPGLTPGRIAAAHHVSVRTLHRRFRDQGTTVAAYIRRRRLEYARHDLSDPRLADRPVHAVAETWGFTRPAEFTRAFRAAYGLPPSDYRHDAVGTRPLPGPGGER
ncbi:helix-turn-helix domain-containing protein [Streptomyces sp. NPDC004609]|uniref:AraC-like ligand-binding domain-containing protein n=1 Tax=Streptomyces sp. NPDC004609 TaxID=3364704 RepID=UPI003687A5D3